MEEIAANSRIAAGEVESLTKTGVNISEDAGKKLGELVPEIEKTANLVQEIYAASLKQNSGAEEINTAIQNLSNIAQNSADSSGNMAEISQELSKQASQLSKLVSYFQIKLNQ